MSRTHNQARTFALITLPVFLFALLPPVLSIDVVTRLLADAAFQDKGNLALLVLYESTRALICLLGLGFAALLVRRRAEQPDARQLVWFLLFGVIAYAYVAKGGGYVGPFQEWLTAALMARGFSRPALYLLFGYPNWAAWLALAGLVRFSLLYPEPLSDESIAGSGAEDRAGMMRSVPGAGLDVGRAARDFVVAAHQRGLLGSAKVWLVSAVGAVLSLVLARSRLNLLLWFPYLGLFTAALTALRASFVAANQTRAGAYASWVARRRRCVAVRSICFGGNERRRRDGDRELRPCDDGAAGCSQRFCRRTTACRPS
jgi:hypothetical protein